MVSLSPSVVAVAAECKELTVQLVVVALVAAAQVEFTMLLLRLQSADQMVENLDQVMVIEMHVPVIINLMLLVMKQV